MNATQILTRDEIRSVVKDLKRRAQRSPSTWQNLIIFRLSCCCGLRCMEIAGLNVGDIAVVGPRPCIRVRKDVTKGNCKGVRKDRLVPLWWDEGTLSDIANWQNRRVTEISGDRKQPFVCRMYRGSAGKRFCTTEVAKRWQHAIDLLGPERAEQLSIHSGRHSFCSHALAAGRSIVEVRDAAGHMNVATTSGYLHFVEREGIPDLFA